MADIAYEAKYLCDIKYDAFYITEYLYKACYEEEIKYEACYQNELNYPAEYENILIYEGEYDMPSPHGATSVVVTPIQNDGDPVADISVDGHTTRIYSEPCRVLYGTSEYWNAQPLLIAAKGVAYVYSDYEDFNGKKLPGIKIGDGLGYLINAPFIDEEYAEHIRNSIIHITQAEREFWNNKMRCYMSEQDTVRLVFTTD